MSARPDLTKLSRDDADFLGMCMGRAIVAFQSEGDNAKLRFGKARPGSRYQAEAVGEARMWNEFVARARAFEDEAHAASARARKRVLPRGETA